MAADSNLVAPVPTPAPRMKVDARALRQLPGRSASSRLGLTARLWLAENGLLQIKTATYAQEIRRFAYRDIQSLQIARTSRGVVYNVILLVTVSMLGLVLLMVRSSAAADPLPTAFCGIGAFIVIVMLLVNVARGPTCVCELQTTLGSQVLSSLSRVRSARRAVDLIAERVEAAQPSDLQGS